MKDKIIKEEIVKQLKLQLESFFVSIDFQPIENCIDEAYMRCMKSISAANEKRLKNSDGAPQFSLYHSSCWAVYLYYLSNSLAKWGGYAPSRYII